MLADEFSRSTQRMAICLLVCASMLPSVTTADMGPPVHMQVTETEDQLYTVRWRVPKALPPRAVPTPVLPEICRPVTDGMVTDQPAAWLIAADWRCEAPLAGRIVGMDYPYPDLSLTTVIRVDLLSGDRFAKVLSQGEESWRLPEGTAAPDILEGLRRAVLAGAGHAALSWFHVLFVLSLGLLGRLERTVRLVTVFTLGQILGLVGSRLVGGLSSTTAEIALLVGVVVIARQAMNPDEERRDLAAPILIAGAVHGLGLATGLADILGDGAVRLAPGVLAILGMDAVHLGSAIAITVIGGSIASQQQPSRTLRLLITAVGAIGVAAALNLAVRGGSSPSDPVASQVVMPVERGPAAAAGTPGSRRLAPSSPNAAVQSFLSVEPFEVRHEVMFRLAGLTEELGIDMGATLDVAAQPVVAEKLSRLVLEGTELRIDGEEATGVLRSADFMIVDPTGALPRPNPVPESVMDANVGVIVSYPTAGMPREVDLRWSRFPDGIDVIPGTVIDPENVSSSVLTADLRTVEWRYALAEDPIPSVEAVQVEPSTVPIPWLSLPLLMVAGWAAAAGLRREHRSMWIATARMVLAAALVVGPVVETAVAVPGSSGRTPSERQARRILAGVLPNIYRALEFRSEELIYDRLAISVTGETLADVYLEQRRALEMEERGGAQARVESVEVLGATEITPGDPGFSVRAEWTVGGMVTHFGHRHFRQNRSDARLDIVPADGVWKIRSIEVFDTERLK